MEYGYLTLECCDCPYWLDGSTWDLGCGSHLFNECPHLKQETEEQTKFKYVYDGPVFIFDQCVDTRWRCETIAVSERKAKNNMLYRWKKDNGYSPNTKVTLPGQITIEI